MLGIDTGGRNRARVTSGGSSSALSPQAWFDWEIREFISQTEAFRASLEASRKLGWPMLLQVPGDEKPDAGPDDFKPKRSG